MSEFDMAPKAMHHSAVREAIEKLDTSVLVGIVMVLTGGWANPETARHHAERVKAEQRGTSAGAPQG